MVLVIYYLPLKIELPARVTKNLNMLHSVRKILIKNEASFKLKLALKHQTRTNGDVTYNTRDIIFCKGKYIPI